MPKSEAEAAVGYHLPTNVAAEPEQKDCRTGAESGLWSSMKLWWFPKTFRVGQRRLIQCMVWTEQHEGINRLQLSVWFGSPQLFLTNLNKSPSWLPGALGKSCSSCSAQASQAGLRKICRFHKFRAFLRHLLNAAAATFSDCSLQKPRFAITNHTFATLSTVPPASMVGPTVLSSP